MMGRPRSCWRKPSATKRPRSCCAPEYTRSRTERPRRSLGGRARRRSLASDYRTAQASTSVFDAGANL